MDPDHLIPIPLAILAAAAATAERLSCYGFDTTTARLHRSGFQLDGYTMNHEKRFDMIVKFRAADGGQTAKVEWRVKGADLVEFKAHADDQTDAVIAAFDGYV